MLKSPQGGQLTKRERDTDTDTCLLWRPPAHTQGEVGGGGWTSQCSHLSVVVGNTYTFVWLLLSSSVHTTRYSIKALSRERERELPMGATWSPPVKPQAWLYLTMHLWTSGLYTRFRTERLRIQIQVRAAAFSPLPPKCQSGGFSVWSLGGWRRPDPHVTDKWVYITNL